MAFVEPQVRPQGEQVDAIAPSRMKLSEAIRIGARLRPQCTGQFFTDGRSCAIGAALEASGTPYGDYMNGLPRSAMWQFGYLFADKRTFSDLGDKIYKRNDSGESRESIADWLASQGL